MNTANQEKNGNISPNVVRDSSARNDRAYQELPGLRHETKDVLKQLQANINSLEDLSGRLAFMLSEVRSLIQR